MSDAHTENTTDTANSPARAAQDEMIERVLAEIDQDELVAFHQALVRLPTVNPPGDVREAVGLCHRTLAAAGFETRQVGDDERKPNLIAEWGTADGTVVCFNAHLDVVPIGERSAWKYDPFGGEIDGGRIYGRGAGDDKGSVAAQVMAGLALARSGIPLRGRLIVNEVADEETNGVHGTAWVVAEGHLKPDFVIVGEQTQNRVCVGEKGSGATMVTVHGRTAHGALPWEGANAIEAMAEIVVALRRELWPQLEARTHEYFHPSSGSVNMISGGVKANVVPDLCSIFIDRRLVPGEDPGDAAAEICAIAEPAVARMVGITVEVTASEAARPATVSPPEAPLVRAMLQANERLGLDKEPTGFSMATDGRFFVEAGFPTIIYGPGDPKLAHVPDEWIGIEELVHATRAYAVAAVLLLGDA
jgi:succinyl-diaminopimelate desuccinylase